MGELKIGRMCMGPVQTNCNFVYDDETKKAVVFDVPCDGEGIYNGLKGKGLTVAGICLTHGHFDHCGGIDAFRKIYEVPVYTYEGERPTIEQGRYNLSGDMGPETAYHVDEYLQDEKELDLAGFHLRLLATPGHTLGGCCFYFPYEKVLFLILLCIHNSIYGSYS